MCKECRECGGSLNAVKRGALFCTPACRKAFNNRRMIRGAELYDLLMANRYERDYAYSKGLWSIACNLMRAYRDSDSNLRKGRKSWNAQETLDRLPIGFGADGDKR